VRVSAAIAYYTILQVLGDRAAERACNCQYDVICVNKSVQLRAAITTTTTTTATSAMQFNL